MARTLQTARKSRRGSPIGIRKSRKAKPKPKPKPKSSPKPHPMPKPARITQAIFSRPAEGYTREALKHILNVFHKKVPPRQRREILLQRAIDLEAELSDDETLTISQLLQQDQIIARKAINEGLQEIIEPDVDDTGEETETASPDDIDPATQCGICLETVSPEEAYHGDLGHVCQHHSLVCIECLDSWVKSQLANEDWRKISCPFCPELLPADLIRIHTPAETLERYYPLSDS